jgi:hypothetical protein
MLCGRATCCRSFAKDVVTFIVSKRRTAVPKNNTTRQAKYVSLKNQERSHNYCCRGKWRTITYSECVPVALIIQHAMRILLIILSPVICLALAYFFTISHKRHYFPEKVIEHEMWILIYFTTFVWNVFHSKQNLARYHKFIQVFMWNTRHYCHTVF